jgi:hypothetical protein
MRLYHITPLENLPSIRTRWLLPHAQTGALADAQRLLTATFASAGLDGENRGFSPCGSLLPLRLC